MLHERGLADYRHLQALCTMISVKHGEPDARVENIPKLHAVYTWGNDAKVSFEFEGGLLKVTSAISEGLRNMLQRSEDMRRVLKEAPKGTYVLRMQVLAGNPLIDSGSKLADAVRKKGVTGSEKEILSQVSSKYRRICSLSGKPGEPKLI